MFKRIYVLIRHAGISGMKRVSEFLYERIFWLTEIDFKRYKYPMQKDLRLWVNIYRHEKGRRLSYVYNPHREWIHREVRI